jgi:phage terminase large subunit-like protein
MAGAVDALEVAIMERKLVHANVPILNWSVGNAVAVTDPAGNRKIDKEKSRFRVDGCVALAMAMGLRARDRGSVHAIDVRALIG